MPGVRDDPSLRAQEGKHGTIPESDRAPGSDGPGRSAQQARPQVEGAGDPGERADADTAYIEGEGEGGVSESRSLGVGTSPQPEKEEEDEEEEEEVAEEEQATPPPPQWDGDAGTAKAYKRMLKKWMDKYGDLDQEETEEEETSSVQAESVTESPNTSQAWELLNEMLKELRSVGVPESASASASMPSAQGTGSHPARGSCR